MIRALRMTYVAFLATALSACASQGKPQLTLDEQLQKRDYEIVKPVERIQNYNLMGWNSLDRNHLIIQSAPSLLQIKLSNKLQRSFETMSTNLNSHNKSSLWISLIAIIPALALVIPGILQSGLGYFGANNAREALFTAVPALEFLINPIILLGGLFLAFIMNVPPAMTFHLERKPEGLTSTITFKPVLLHWIFIGTSVLMVSIILIYGFVENFGPLF